MRPTLLAAAVAVLAPAVSLAQAGASAPASALTRIGAAAAVHGKVRAQAPDAAIGRVVESGKPIFLNDHVTTDAAGKLQVLLLDETVFTLGPSADMVLDEYVYNPETDEGQVSARISKGVFRFVTGRVARRDPAKMQVKLPSGTIGIRGTMVLGEAKADESTVILLGPGGQTNTDEPSGAILVTNNGVSRFISAAGKGVTLKPNMPPSPVKDLSAKAMELQTQLQTPPDFNAMNANANGVIQQTATQQADQTTQQAHQSSDETLTDTQSADEQNQLFTQAAQTAGLVADGQATWEQIRSNITTGQGYFFEGDSTNVSCAACAAGSGSIGSFQLQVDFGARTLGGSGGVFNPTSSASGSFIHIHGVNNAGATDTDQQLINTISFASLSGNSQILLNSYLNTPTSTGGSSTVNFNGSNFKLMNSGGKVAATALVDFHFTGVSATSAVVNASGSLNAPRY